MAVVALISTGGPGLADAHISDNAGPLYHDVFLEMTDYERVSYGDFDIIQIGLKIDNNEPFPLIYPTFLLGGVHNGTDDSDLAEKKDYGISSYGDIVNKGGESSKSYCTVAGDTQNIIRADSSGTVWLCFDVDDSFLPDGLLVSGDIGHTDMDGMCYTSSGRLINYDFRHSYTNWPVCAIQVVPLNEDSTYCNYQYSRYCNDTNLQNITKWTEPDHEPEPVSNKTDVEPDDTNDAKVTYEPDTASLQYAIYSNGTLVLIFDQPVTVNNQDRIGIITDWNIYQRHGDYSDIGNANLSRMDTTPPHDEVLVFSLSNSTHELVTDYVNEYNHVDVVIDVGAIHVGEGDTDITKYNNDEPVLFYDAIIIE